MIYIKSVDTLMCQKKCAGTPATFKKMLCEFPIFIKIKKEKELYHNDILSKKLGFLSKLFSGIFIFEQASDFVSFFSDRTFIYDRENNNFLIKNGETKFVHRVYDVIFGVSFGIFMQIVVPAFRPAVHMMHNPFLALCFAPVIFLPR